jgi:hypothetical protein
VAHRVAVTTLGSLLAAKYGIPYFSIDHVASVIPPYIDPQRQDESFPLRAARRKANNDNDVFFEAHSADEVVSMYWRQAATCWRGSRALSTRRTLPHSGRLAASARFLVEGLAIPSFFEIKESDGVRMLSEKNRISFFRSPRCLQT